MLKIALGTAQFGFAYGITNRLGQIPLAEARAIVDRARGVGIKTIDTAIGYGASEDCLGAIGVSDFKVVSKLPAVPDGCLDVEQWVVGQFNQSIARLGVHGLYGLLLHRPHQLMGDCGKQLYKALQGLKSAGRVQKIGYSVYSPNDLADVLPSFPCDLVQAPLSLVDRRLVQSGWASQLHGLGIELHVRSAFLQGLLLLGRQDLPVHFGTWRTLFDRWHDWLERDGNQRAIAACLAFPLSIPEVDRVVIGTDGLAQFGELVDALHDPLPSAFPDIASNDIRLINPSLWPTNP